MVEYLIPKSAVVLKKKLRKVDLSRICNIRKGLEQAKAFGQKLKRSTLMPAIIVGRQWPASQRILNN